MPDVEHRKFKVNLPLNGPKGNQNFFAGSEVMIQFVDGLPSERYWRNRLRDSKIDNCIQEIMPIKANGRKR